MQSKAVLNNWKTVAADITALALGRVEAEADLRQYSRWKIGGKAALVVEPDSIKSLSTLVRYLFVRSIPYIVVGDGSNLLFDDRGLNAVIIRIGRALSSLKVNGNVLQAQAGLWVPRLAHASLLAGLTGLEHVIGIPGTVGGLACMNGGSQRKGIGDNIVSITAITPDGEIRSMEKAECGFAYRTSAFQSGIIVAECEIKLEPAADPKQVRREMLEIMASRRLRFPLKLPNCGSVFVSNPAMYNVVGAPGKAIENVGLKGYSIGGARSSHQHANFIVNENNASSFDVLALIHKIRQEVYAKTGYWMDSEVRYVSPNGDIVPAHQAEVEKVA